MPKPLITLTTDFGEGSPYVAEMKASILRVQPDATLLDITHALAPQDIRHGALVLDTVTPQFPPDTIHLCVVDPGVGSDRSVVCARIEEHHYVAPNNGLLSLLAERLDCTLVIRVQNPAYWNTSVSATFHGRDIMAPVAAHLSLGVPPQQLGPSEEHLVRLPWPEVRHQPDGLNGTVLIIDHFGNLITNITRAELPSAIDHRHIQIACRGQMCTAWVDWYAQAPPGTLVALFGSSERLEIAVSGASAAEQLQTKCGDTVQLRWLSDSSP